MKTATNLGEESEMKETSAVRCPADEMVNNECVEEHFTPVLQSLSKRSFTTAGRYTSRYAFRFQIDEER